MACGSREKRSWRWIWWRLVRGRIKEIFEDEYLFGDMFGPVICYFRGHNPVLLNENDPECQIIICKTCHKNMSR